MAAWCFPFDTDTGILIAAEIRRVLFRLGSGRAGHSRRPSARGSGKAVLFRETGALEGFPLTPEPQPGHVPPGVLNSDA